MAQGQGAGFRGELICKRPYSTFLTNTKAGGSMMPGEFDKSKGSSGDNEGSPARDLYYLGE